MRMFTLDKNGNLVLYQEEAFQDNNKEVDLEEILEKNPDYFFEKQKIMIIGRQVSTNFNTFIDLLGITSRGNTVIIELKRDRTTRDTLAQLLEYASFIDTLDYDQLNEIFKSYYGEEIELEAFYNEYYSENEHENISWNKYSILLIVGQAITKEIKQTSQYLRKKGIDVRCIEFKYFTTDENEKVFTCDFVVGEEDIVRRKLQTTALPKVNKDIFIETVDQYGKNVFDKIFSYIEKNDLLIRWGSKGFSVNHQDNEGFVALFFCYPRHCVFKQSIYTGYDEIDKKVKDSEEIIKYYKIEVKKLSLFINAQKSEKWIITQNVSDEIVDKLLRIVDSVRNQIRQKGWK